MCDVRVRRRVWLIPSAALVAALLPSMATAPDFPKAGRQNPTVVTDEQVRQWPVRIEEQLVRVETAGTPEEGPRPVSQRRSVRRRDARDDAESAVSRARRFLLGDGEARPEPFPRPR